MTKRLLVLLVCLCLLPLQGLCAIDAEEMHRRFAQNRTVGGAAIVSLRGKPVFSYAYGFKDAQKRNPVTLDTCFRIASVTKLVTAVGVMQLCEKHQVNLDAPVSAYLGYNVSNPAYPKAPITLRQILTHTTGFATRNTYHPAWEKIGKNNKLFIKNVAPGTKYHYSNLNGSLLAPFIENMSGQSINSYMAQNVFLPLKMNAAYHPALLQDTSDISSQLYKDGTNLITAERALESIDKYDDTCNPQAHTDYSVGQLYISANALDRLMAMFVLGGKVNEHQILSEETVEFMLTSQNFPGSSVQAQSPYTLGLDRVFDLPGGTWYGHQGRKEGLCSNAYFQPETGLSVVVIANGSAPKLRNNVSTLALWLMEQAQGYLVP